MTYKVNNVKVYYKHKPEDLLNKVKKQMGIKEILSYKIHKQSLDARKKPDLYYLYSLVVETNDQVHPKAKDVSPYEEKPSYAIPTIQEGTLSPVVVGFGPAGIFCAYVLAKAGLKPVVLERGQAVEDRLKTTETYFKTGALDTESNIQFGEGGAGTFSDGKLSTGIKDRFGRKDYVLETFVEHGAPEEITYSNKPHIGTDYLTRVVKSMRQEIIRLGGQVHFNSKMTGFEAGEKGLLVQADTLALETDHLVLALGHSARDTFEILTQTPLTIEQKAFAMGLRIQHPQEVINDSQYGKGADMDHLPVSDYKLTYRTKKGRGVYSFCMCPGGYVVNSASEHERVVCNGMSYYKRDAKNANSALLVNVTPEDFGSQDVLAGVAMQRHYEHLAYEVAGSDYSMPIQTLSDFNEGKVSTAFGATKPCVKGAVAFGDLNQCLPEFISEAIKEALPEFGKKIRGFDHKDTLLIGIESRSSSPIKILRDDQTLESPMRGVYPCGEGAGYAGGIMSAAIDGIKVAESILKTYA